MKKIFCVLAAAVLLCTAGCKESVAEPTDTQPPATTQPATEPVQTPAVEQITEAELLEQFLLAYEGSGSSVSQDESQLTAELSALKSAAQADKKEWPQDFEEQYKTWRESIIAEQAAALKAEYDKIIVDREHYTLSGSNGEPETPGLFYADYLDMDGDGRKELLLLTWSHDSNSPILFEIYQEEDSHAVKCFEQKIDLLCTPFGTCLSLVSSGKNIYLQAAGYEMHMGAESYEYLIFGINGDQFGLVDWLSYYTELTDPRSENPTYEAHYFSKTSADNHTEIAEEQYQATMSQYGSIQAIASVNEFHIYSGSGEGVYMDDPVYTGVLFPMQRTPAKVELNGQPLELSAEAYADGGAFMAPLRDVLEAIGITVYANSDVSVVLASTKKDTLTITNKLFMYSEEGIEVPAWDVYNGYRCYLNEWSDPYWNGCDIRAEIINGKLFASVDKIVSLLGFGVSWDGDAKALKITGELVPAADHMSDQEIKAMANFGFNAAVKLGEEKGYQFYGMGVAYIEGGLFFSQGKAIWEYAVLPAGEEAYGSDGTRAPDNMFYIQVSSDGSVTKSST